MSKLKILSAFIASFVVAGLLSLGPIFYLFQPVDSSAKQFETFVVPKGQAISIIAQRLEDEGLIRSALVFRFEVERKGIAKKLQAGSFRLSPNMSVSEIADELISGTEDLWITILEGWRVEQIADSLVSQPLANFDRDEFLLAAKGKEGYLYPDTYLIPKEMTATQIVSLLENTFERKVTTELEGEWQSSGLSFEEIITLASLVEREAKSYEQKRRVAGILLNRLGIGMALQVDATLQYVKGYNQVLDEWWVPPTAADKSIKSLFNTYLNPGLPPHPIANPGFDAVQAVLNPIESNHLYYIHDRQGRMHYAETLEEHNANVDKYL